MDDFKCFSLKMPDNHRHAVVIDVRVGFSVNIAEFSGVAKAEVSAHALIDTGANRSCVSKRLIAACKLEAITQMAVRSAQGISEANVYSADIALPSEIVFQNVPVMEFSGGSDFDVIIGMDILNCCDFAFSNANSETFFTLRTPPALPPVDFTNYK